MPTPPAGEVRRSTAEYALRATADDRRALEATLARVVSWRHCVGRGDYQRLEPLYWERRGHGIRAPLLDGRGPGEEYGFDAAGELIIRRDGEIDGDDEMFEFAIGTFAWIRYSRKTRETREVVHLDHENGPLLRVDRLIRGPGDPHRTFQMEDYTYVEGDLKSIQSWVTVERADTSMESVETTWAVDGTRNGASTVSKVEESVRPGSAIDPSASDGAVADRAPRQAVALSSGKALLLRLFEKHGCDPQRLDADSAQQAFAAFEEFLGYSLEVDGIDGQQEVIMFDVTPGATNVAANLTRIVSLYDSDVEGEYVGREGFIVSLLFAAADIGGTPPRANIAGGEGLAAWVREVKADPAFAMVFGCARVPTRIVVSDGPG